MDHRVTEVLLKSPAESLCWRGDVLMDWVGGNREIGLDGSDSGRQVIWGYRFDAAVASRCGQYAVIYERLGTKGVVLDHGTVLREINRSYYCAGSYEYPVVMFEHGGRVLMAHCPEEYDRVDIDDVENGVRLTARTDRKPEDFFHSRLAVSPDQRRLLSAGWFWHPYGSASAWSIEEALADARVLDAGELGAPTGPIRAEISSAVFVDADRVLLSSSPDPDGQTGAASEFGSGRLGMFNVETRAFESVVPIEEAVGTMMWLGEGRVVSFFEHPKVIEVLTGEVVHRWPQMATGRQDGSIISDLDQLPHVALDPVGRRFAVAGEKNVMVVQL